jgi:hypothetical protein
MASMAALFASEHAILQVFDGREYRPVTLFRFFSGSITRTAMFLAPLFTLIANLLPLAGVWWWGWDMFQVLMLYWMETILLVVFTVLNVGKMPAAQLGTVKVNGRTRPATHRDLMLAFAIMGFVFCAAHLLFSFVFFSGNWTRVVRGPVTFWQHMVIASGAWAPLLLTLIAGLAHYVLTPPHPRFIAPAMTRIGFVGRPAAGDINSAYTTLFWRIFAMQAAIIFGAMFVQSYKATNAPLYILIALKTLTDLASTARRKPQVMTSLRK